MYNKYKNNKCVVDGIVFDSRREARRYKELMLMQAAGKISRLQRQVKFVLIPAQYLPTGEVYKRGEKKGQPKMKLAERECSYIADYVYYDSNNKLHVEDVKGYKGGEAYNLFKIKRKMMLYIHKIRVEEG